MASIMYATYIYNAYVVPISQRFPEPVANKLRRAIFYSNVELDPQRAVDYYKQALALAAETGMDQFSDEIIGVKLTLVALMEKIGKHQLAIDILEILRTDCLNHVEELAPSGESNDRARILGKTVAISLKLGELYGNQYIDDSEAVERNLVTAVEIGLREEIRREEENVGKAGDGWMESEEMGATMECTLPLSPNRLSPPSSLVPHGLN